MPENGLDFLDDDEEEMIIEKVGEEDVVKKKAGVEALFRSESAAPAHPSSDQLIKPQTNPSFSLLSPLLLCS